MKGISLILFVPLFFQISCGNINSKQRHRELIQDSVSSIPKIPEKVPITKYIYISIAAKQPNLRHFPRKIISDDNITPGHTVGRDLVIPETNSVSWNRLILKSAIFEINDYTEDKSYKYMDKYEDKVKQQLHIDDENFRNKVDVLVHDDVKASDLLKHSCKIIERKCNTFDSYKSASIQRESDTGQYLQSSPIHLREDGLIY